MKQMNPKQIEKNLRLVVLGGALCCAGLYFCGFPLLGHDLAERFPEYALWYLPWLLFLWATGIPCFLALGTVWRMAGTLRAGRVFTRCNSVRFRRVSFLAAGDAVFLLAGNLVFLVLNGSHPGVFLLSAFIAFAGFAAVVVCQALALLTDRAAELQEESDWTI